ncbi:hypothetical protein DI005_28930 [Prauserella sp. PE36]|nr:hypothetical protein DI005_28930 [Prauserella sp. PE36]
MWRAREIRGQEAYTSSSTIREYLWPSGPHATTGTRPSWTGSNVAVIRPGLVAPGFPHRAPALGGVHLDVEVTQAHHGCTTLRVLPVELEAPQRGARRRPDAVGGSGTQTLACSRGGTVMIEIRARRRVNDALLRGRRATCQSVNVRGG